ncbi:MAG TPA: hemerythrin domain-containing protein [Trichocoleus sp.]|jgi:hemerythrin superfamily protein
MVTTLDDAKRNAIAVLLADVKAVQNFLIEIDQQLISECGDDDIRSRVRDMLRDDQKNIGIIDTVIVQYGIKAEPKSTITQMIDQGKKLMQGSQLSLLEKFSQFELLKHGQTMKGLLVHKCAQVVGADIEAAITPLNAVNFENRAHQEQLKGILEKIGVRELTGKEADQGLWGRVQDAVAALSGVAGSVISRTDDEMNVQDVIRMDHNKVNMLFAQIEATDDPQKIQEYFGQIYKDLTVHAKAEEQVVYPKVRSFYGKTDDLYKEQDEMEVILNQLKSMTPSSSNFKDELRQLRDLVMHHVQQEENEMFAVIRNNFSSDEQEQLATQFKSAKSQLQDQMKSSSMS